MIMFYSTQRISLHSLKNQNLKKYLTILMNSPLFSQGLWSKDSKIVCILANHQAMIRKILSIVGSFIFLLIKFIMGSSKTNVNMGSEWK